MEAKHGVVIIYQLVNLLDFYGKRFNKLLGINTDLNKTFEMLDIIIINFLKILKINKLN